MALSIKKGQGTQASATDETTGPFQPGTPELSYLRSHLDYLTRSPAGVPSFAWRMLLGLIINFAVIALSLNLVGRPLGWLYGWWFPHLRAGVSHPSITLQFWIPWVAIGLGILAVLIGVSAVGLRTVNQGEGKRKTYRFSVWAFLLAALFAVMTIAIPELLVFLRGTVARLASSNSSGSTSVTNSTHRLAIGAIVSAVVSAATLITTLLRGKVGATSGAPSSSSAPDGATAFLSTVWGWVKAPILAFTAKHRKAILNTLAAVIVPVGLLATLTLAVETGTNHTLATAPLRDVLTQVLLWWLLPSLLLVVFWWYSDINCWSMHTFYKQRLGTAFALQRIHEMPQDTAGAHQGPAEDTVEVTEEALEVTEEPTGMQENPEATEESPTARQVATNLPTRVEERLGRQLQELSELQSLESPELLVATTVNLSDQGAAPTGLRAASYTLSANRIGCRAPNVGTVPTACYERIVGPRRDNDLSLLAAISISSAALAPEMGSMTRGPFKALMTLANVRLGVWVPNPSHVAKRARWTADGEPVISRPHRIAPRFHYLWRELLGYNRSDAAYLYLTDGGHYDNLGLVELLRRKCKTIYCIDSSGETINSFSTIFNAMRIANAELNIDFESFDPTTLGPTNTNSRQVNDVMVTGTFTNHQDYDGTICVVKAGVPVDAPPVLLNYQAANSKFPYETTLDQFYTAEQFDAYRFLGQLCTERIFESKVNRGPSRACDGAAPDVLVDTQPGSEAPQDASADGNRGPGAMHSLT